MGFKNAGNFNQWINILRGVHQIFCPRKAQPRDLAQLFDHQKNVFAGGGYARTHRRAAKVDHAQPLRALEHAPAVAREALRPGRTLHAKGHRHGILQLGAAHLENMAKGQFLFLKGRLQGGNGLFQILEQKQGGNPHRSWVHIVGGLVKVHMTQGVYAGVRAKAAPKQFFGPVGEYLVHIHVGGRSRAALQGIHHKGMSQTPLGNLAAGIGNGLRLGLRQIAKLRVGAAAGQLDESHWSHKLGPDGPARKWEICQRTGRMYAPVCRQWDIHCAQCVRFLPV